MSVFGVLILEFGLNFLLEKSISFPVLKFYTCGGWKRGCKVILPKKRLRGEITKYYFLPNSVYLSHNLEHVFWLLFSEQRSQCPPNHLGGVLLRQRRTAPQCTWPSFGKHYDLSTENNTGVRFTKVRSLLLESSVFNANKYKMAAAIKIG